MKRSILDFNVMLPGHESAGPEPTLRILVYQYYSRHFSENAAINYAQEYIRQVEHFADTPHRGAT